MDSLSISVSLNLMVTVLMAFCRCAFECHHCWDLSVSVSVSMCVRVFDSPHLSLHSPCTNLSFFLFFFFFFFFCCCFKRLVSFYTKRLQTVGRISKKTSRYKTYILIIMKILVVNKTNIMLYWHEKKTTNNPNENRGFS